jgi:hypothetical protein
MRKSLLVFLTILFVAPILGGCCPCWYGPGYRGYGYYGYGGYNGYGYERGYYGPYNAPPEYRGYR